MRLVANCVRLCSGSVTLGLPGDFSNQEKRGARVYKSTSSTTVEILGFQVTFQTMKKEVVEPKKRGF
jgi:hypothetical protein